MKTSSAHLGFAVLMIILLSACGGGGGEGGGSQTSGDYRLPASMPATPCDFTLTGSRSQARLAWSAVDGADHYNIYMDGDFVGSSTACSFTQSGLETGSTHEFQVSAVNGAGESARCAEAKASANPWTKLLGWTLSDTAYCVAVDDAGNIYIAGSTNGRLDGKPNSGGYDAFVAKYDPTGVKLWVRLLGSTENDGATSIAVDGAGNIYIAGFTYGSLDGNARAGSSDAFIAKYDSTGAKQWVKLLGSTDYDRARGIAVDGGNIYIAGYTFGSLDGNPNAGGYDAFIAKYDPAGVKHWVKLLGSSQGDIASSIAVDGAGNIHIAGTTYGDLELNANAGANDAFIAKYDPAGAKQWVVLLGSAEDDGATGIAVDGVGNIYITGSTSGDLGGISNAGVSDAFIARFDPAGVKQWATLLGSAGGDSAEGISLDGSGNIYIAGYTYGSLDGNANSGNGDAFIARFDPSGVKQWVSLLGTTSVDYAYGIAVDIPGHAYIAGSTGGNLDGNTNSGLDDAFIAKVLPDGTIW